MEHGPAKSVAEVLARSGGESTLHIGVFGSVDFYHPASDSLCVALGNALGRALPSAVLLTGANAVVHERLARAFHDTVSAAGERPSVFHLAPAGYHCAFDFGEVLKAGMGAPCPFRTLPL